MSENKFATPFSEMAERISRNLETEFGGAILIVPPEGDPIAVVVTDPKKDMEAFWAVAEGRIMVAVQEFKIAKQGSGGFQRR